MRLGLILQDIFCTVLNNTAETVKMFSKLLLLV